MTQAPVLLDKSRTALVFIEFQREWLSPAGTLFTNLVQDKAAFRQAVANAAAVLETARRTGWQIAHAGLDLREDPRYHLFGRGVGVTGLRGAIPRAGTWTGDGAEFVAPFVPQVDEYTVRGRSGASVLRNSTLDPFLRNNRLDTVVLLGFATHVCVESTLREAHDTGLNAVVASDGCAAFTTAQHTHVLDHVVHHFGQQVTTTDLVAQLDAQR